MTLTTFKCWWCNVVTGSYVDYLEHGKQCRHDNEGPVMDNDSPHGIPDHYMAKGMQPFDIIDAFRLDFYLGNVIKYVCRAGRKKNTDKLDDLRKAAHYIDEAIRREEDR